MKNIKKFEHFNIPDEEDVYSKTHKSTNYMFFANLQNIQRYIDALKSLPKEEVDEMLSEHDWASDHISVACENIEHVHNFLVNSFSDHIPLSIDDEDENEFDAEYEEEYDEDEIGEDDNEQLEEDEDQNVWQDEEVEQKEEEDENL